MMDALNLVTMTFHGKSVCLYFKNQASGGIYSIIIYNVILPKIITGVNTCV